MPKTASDIFNKHFPPPPPPEDKILYVRNSFTDAKKLLKELGLAKITKYMAGYPGMPLAGYRFDKIIIDVDSTQLSYIEQGKFLKWRDHAETKLKPEGKLIHLQ